LDTISNLCESRIKQFLIKIIKQQNGSSRTYSPRK
jgi:hypothetical protein